MAVINAIIKSGGQGGSSDGNIQSRRLTFRVRTNNPADDTNVVLRSPLIPRRGSIYLNDRSLRCKSYDVSQVDQLTWDVTVNYESPSFGSSGYSQESRQDFEDRFESMPDSFLPSWDGSNFRVTTGFRVIEVPADVDAIGKPYRNSCGERFDPLPKKKIYLPTCTVTRTEYTPPYKRAKRFANKANDARFFGVDPGGIMIEQITSETTTLDKWEVTYPFVVLQDTRDSSGAIKNVLIDSGYNEWVDSANHNKGLKRISIAGVDTTKQQLLDGNGKLLTNQNSQGIKLYFDEYVRDDFSLLDMPQIELV